MGSHKRLKYGVLGDGVNLASRLEELNKRYETEVLVSSDTYDSNAVAGAFLARPVDIVVVKGKSVPTTLWEIVAERESSDPLAAAICKLQTEVILIARLVARSLAQLITLQANCLFLTTPVVSRTKAMSDFLQQNFDECCSKMELAFEKEKEHAASYVQGGAFIRMQYNTTRSLYNRARFMVGSPKRKAWNGSEVLNEKHF